MARRASSCSEPSKESYSSGESADRAAPKSAIAADFALPRSRHSQWPNRHSRSCLSINPTLPRAPYQRGNLIASLDSDVPLSMSRRSDTAEG
jgi:hypothetical protein